MKRIDLGHLFVYRFEKTRPGWMEKRGQWQHGIELPDYEEACAVENRGTPVRVEIVEKLSPEDPQRKSECVPPGSRLWILLADIRLRGTTMSNWPDGQGGPSGRGGRLWPRNIMHNVTAPAAVQGRLF